MKHTTTLAMLALVACGSPDGAKTSGQKKLENYQWKNRVILHHQAPEEMLELSKAERADFENRDLVFLKADEGLQEKFSLDGDQAVFVLIGKDGREKGGQKGRLDLAEWFDLIDTMPMRKREMEEGQDDRGAEERQKFSQDW